MVKKPTYDKLEKRIKELEATKNNVRQFEEALERSDDVFSSLFDDYTSIKLIIDPDTGAIVSANDAAADFYGWSRESLAQMNINQINPLPSDEIRKSMQETRDRKRTRFEVQHRLADGSVRDVEIFRSRFIKAGHEYLHSIVYDISKRKRTEREKAIIAEINRIISSSLNIDEVYERFTSEVKKLIDFEWLSVELINYRDGTVRISCATDTDVFIKRQQGDVFPLAGSLTEKILQSRKGFIARLDNLERLSEYHPHFVIGFQEGLRSAMCVLLHAKGKVIGTLNFRSTTPNAFTEQDLALAQQIADQIAGAIANAQVYADLKRAEQEIAVIAEIGRIIGSSLNIGEVYGRFTTEVKKLIDFEWLSVGLIDYQKGTVRIVHTTDTDIFMKLRQGDVFPLAGSLTEKIVQARKGVIAQLDGLEEIAKHHPHFVTIFQAGIRSLMSVALRSQDKVIGTLNFRSKTPNAYTEQELALAQRIGDQIAGVIANAQVYSDLKRAEQEMAVIAEIGRIIGSSLDIDEVYEGFTAEVKKLISFDRLTVALNNIRNGMVRIAYVSKSDLFYRRQGDDFPMAGSLNETVLKTRTGLIASMETLEEVAKGYPSLVTSFKLGAKSALSVPLFSHGDVIGTLGFRSTKSNAYTERDLSLAQRIADQIAGAIANAALYGDLKETEKALREANALFSHFMHHSPIYAFIKEVTPTRSFVLQASENFQQITGIPGHDMIGKSMEELFPAEFAAKITADDWAVVSDGKVLTLEEELNGRSFTTIKFPIVDSGKHLLAGYSIDVTERNRIEAQLVQAQKMESVGRLAGGVAHDFNNMLGVILGHTELALTETGLTHAFKVHLQEIKRAAEHSANLTHQLLAFARKQTIAPKVMALNDTVAKMLKMLQRIIGEDIDLSWQPAADLWPIKMDPSQLDQILANLCVNARDAISGIGKITIETANHTFDEDYCTIHKEFLPGDYVRLSVSDSGSGMDKETLSHLFEPFYTTKDVGQGTGLGLATVYGTVRQNNGFISVYSELGHGTTFRIYFLRHRGKREQAQSQVTQETPARGQETILVVEDEQGLLDLTTTLLKNQGYTVLSAITPGEAIRLASEYPGEIHLLMTDVIMPEMNGRKLAKKLLTFYPGLKRLFTSGYTANVIAHHGVLDEGVHFIPKPFTITELATKVRDVLDEN